jgi:hypothetical protein
VGPDTSAGTHWLWPQERWAVARLYEQPSTKTLEDKGLARRRKAFGERAFVLYCASQGDNWLGTMGGLAGIAVLFISRTQGVLGVIGYAMLGLAFLSGVVMFVRTRQTRHEIAEFKRQQQEGS